MDLVKKRRGRKRVVKPTPEKDRLPEVNLPLVNKNKLIFTELDAINLLLDKGLFVFDKYHSQWVCKLDDDKHIIK